VAKIQRIFDGVVGKVNGEMMGRSGFTVLKMIQPYLKHQTESVRPAERQKIYLYPGTRYRQVFSRQALTRLLQRPSGIP
jgi:hypothetical protein